jgi:hypothetical protein
VPFIPLALPAHDVADYLKRYGIAAIMVLAPASECPCQFAIGIDVAKAVAEARRAWPKGRDQLRLAGARWAGSIASAAKVLDMILECDLRRARKVGNAFHIPVTEALAAVDSAARRLDIRLTAYGAAIERARQAVGQLDQAIETVQDAGDLKAFNQEYAWRRRLAAAAGESFLTYGQARARLRAILAASASTRSIASDAIARVFDQT